MTTAMTCSWLDEATRDLEMLPPSAGPAVGRRIARAVARLSRINGGSGLGDAFTRPGTTPFVRAIDALAADLGLSGDPRVALVGRATVLLYLYVRMQDDLVDEEEQVDRATVFAMELVLSKHLALLADAGLSHDGQRARSDIMARFADVAADELDLRAEAKALPVERLGDKFLPMAVPLVALASIAGRDAIGDALVSFVQTVGSSLQWINDVLNAAEDRALARPTSLLSAASPETAHLRGNDLRAALLSDPATRTHLDQARRGAERAAEAARALGLPALGAVAAAVASNVSATDGRLLAIMLGER